MKQEEIFYDGEGNKWFERNKSSLNENKEKPLEINFIFQKLQDEQHNLKKILEIGCGNAVKLNSLCDHFQASGYGIDPSKDAIESGKQHYSELDLRVGDASVLPFEDSSFDFVFFGFCLYLVDRSSLFKAVAEADRVLKQGGFLAILDFDPNLRHKRPYHHKAGVFSYKTSYVDFFTAGGHYYLVAKESFSHAGNQFTRNSDERVSISLLYKEIDPYSLEKG